MKNSIRFPFLLKAEIFEELDTSFTEDFLNACSMVVCNRTTVIYEQGQQAENVMIIAHGYVDVTYLGRDGQQMFIIRLRPGTAIAEMEVISEEPCMATCKTSPDAILLSCPKELLSQSVLEPAFLKSMIRAFYKRLSYVNWSKHLAQFGSVDKSLRGYLYVLSEHTSTIRETQANLAIMVGCSRQTINRELSQLRKEGLIDQFGSKITVLNRDALRDSSADYFP